MTLPTCYRCGEQPCDCDKIKVTLKRLILGELAEHGRMSGDQLEDAVAEMYQRAQMECPWLLIEEVISSLVCGRRIRRIAGKWEGEYFYTVRKVRRRIQQEVLF